MKEEERFKRMVGQGAPIKEMVVVPWDVHAEARELADNEVYGKEENREPIVYTRMKHVINCDS